MGGDWVCLYRRLADHPIRSDSWLAWLFVYCILRAQWKQSDYILHVVKRGQFGARMSDLAKELKKSRHQVLRGLEKLESMGMVKTENVNNQFTMITVCNYSAYQNRPEEECTTPAQPPHNLRTTPQQPPTLDSSSEEQRKQGKQKRFDPVSVEFPMELRTDGFREAWTRWVHHRSEIKKPLKPTMVGSQLVKFKKMGANRAITMIDHTVENGWVGLREPESNGKPKPKARLF